jgi:hypothetical protein
MVFVSGGGEYAFGTDRITMSAFEQTLKRKIRRMRSFAFCSA